MASTVYWIIWLATFGTGWICVDMFKKKKNKSFWKIALVMFGLAVIISAYRCLSLWIK